MLRLIFRRQVGFLLATALLCVTGALLATRLPVQLYPQTQRPRVMVRISHTGISAVDFAGDYADTIEPRLLSIDGADTLEVRYENDRSFFTLTFDWNSEAKQAKIDVEAAMNSISTLLPEEYRDRYSVGFFSGENAGYLMLGLSSPTVNPEALYALLDSGVEPLMSRVEDAESVEFYNVEDLEARVILRQADLLAYGLTIVDVEAALEGGYRPESVGRLRQGDTTFSVRHRRGIDSLYDLGRIVVAQSGDVFIRLQDVADVSVSYELPGRAFVMDGARGIRITASPIDGGNVRRMSQQVREVLEEAIAGGLLPSDTVVQAFLDPADYINRSIRNVINAALIGAGLAVLVVLLSLGEIRNTLLIALTIPASVVLSFILLYLFGVSLNLISLGGLALAVGMVVDAAVVVMENIHRFRQTEAPIRDNGHLVDLTMRAVRQVRPAVIGSTLTSVMVFLPIQFTAPLTNAILGDQARTVVYALLLSMAIALSLLPLLAALLYRVGGRGATADLTVRGLARASVPVMGFFKDLYTRALRGLLRRRGATVLFMLCSFALLAAAVLGVLPRIPKQIISPPSSDRVVIFMRSPTVSDQRQVLEEVIPAVERRVRETVGEHVVRTYADVSDNSSRYFVNLKSPRETAGVLAALQKAFVSDNTWYYNVQMWDPAELPLPRTMDLQISVHGPDAAVAVTLLERVRDLVNATELYGWAFTNPNTSFSDELAMSTRAEVIDGFSGLSERSLLTLVRKILGGTNTVEFEHGEQTVSVQAEYPEQDIEGRQAVENFLVPYGRGTVPLKHFFDFRESTGVSGIASEDGERIFRLYARMPPNTPAARRLEFENRVRGELEAKLDVPQGYTVSFDNPQTEMEQAIRSLFVALAASVVLMYLWLAFEFNSLRIPLVILVTVPLGFIGVVFSLYLFKSTLSLNSMLGTILLAGIVVNNAIVMIEFYLQILPGHGDRVEALVQTASLRFTPIMITSLTTIFGMLPIAIGLGEGSNIIQPLGIAVSGGLLVSTMFTLFMVPAILSFMRLRPPRRFGGAAAAEGGR
jgi:HAE1 family hydrophobic/amphiphilic exporter-1